METLAKKCDLSEAEVSRWVKEIEKARKPSQLEKLGETCWRTLSYAALFSFGLWSLWDKPYFRDTKACWEGYPQHPIPKEIYWCVPFTHPFIHFSYRSTHSEQAVLRKSELFVRRQKESVGEKAHDCC